MKGHPQVIAHLNGLLAGELTAIDQYFIHSCKFADWGLSRLHAQLVHEMTEEQAHAEALIRRILFLEGQPDLKTRLPLKEGNDVISMLRNDLELEYAVIAHLRQVMAFCESVEDFATRDILLTLLKDTEQDHAWWLERQLKLIELMGVPNYLQTQL